MTMTRTMTGIDIGTMTYDEIEDRIELLKKERKLCTVFHVWHVEKIDPAGYDTMTSEISALSDESFTRRNA